MYLSVPFHGGGACLKAFTEVWYIFYYGKLCPYEKDIVYLQQISNLYPDDMARTYNWSDDYWLPLMQLYLRKPAGIKPMYSRPMVDLSLELHIHPSVLFARMCAIANQQTPYMERLWETYGNSPRRLSAAVKRLKGMSGFCNAAAFYDGVKLCETFELDFRPVYAGSSVTPVMLILMMDLYFRLTPATMVVDTPEIVELARLTGQTPALVTDVMQMYRHCDPYLKRQIAAHLADSPLLPACRAVWWRFGNSSIESLAAHAEELRQYFV